METAVKRRTARTERLSREGGAVLKRVGRLLIITGKATSDMTDMVRRDREARMRKLAGPRR